MKSARFENVSSCARTAQSCGHAREVLQQTGQPYGPCLPQARAACFTFHNALQEIDTFDCSATLEACSRQRAYALAQTKDITNASDCGGVD
jgi:hypothetical protein